MQDQDRWRDRVELSLDNRQIFLLFTASAVVLSLVFALGVVVGKRADGAAAAQPPADPLALLDRFGGAASDADNLTFPDVLAGTKKPVAAATSTDPQTAAAAAAAQAAAKPPQTTPQPPSSARRATAGAAATAKPAAGGTTRVAKAAPPKGAKPARSKAGSGERGKTASGKTKTTKVAKKAAGAGPAKKGFTLQLSSFQERLEAEQFMTKLRKQGHQPHMVPARIPGRGLWYRVRLGNYDSWEVALKAKNAFEKQFKAIAYVTRQ